MRFWNASANMRNRVISAAFTTLMKPFIRRLPRSGRVPGLWDIVQQAKLQLDRFRQFTLPEPGRMSIVLVEHTDILKAIESKDPERASQMMDSHLNKLQNRIKPVVDAHPDIFIHDADLDDLVSL